MCPAPLGLGSLPSWHEWGPVCPEKEQLSRTSSKRFTSSLWVLMYSECRTPPHQSLQSKHAFQELSYQAIAFTNIMLSIPNAVEQMYCYQHSTRHFFSEGKQLLIDQSLLLFSVPCTQSKKPAKGYFPSLPSSMSLTRTQQVSHSTVFEELPGLQDKTVTIGNRVLRCIYQFLVNNLVSSFYGPRRKLQSGKVK